MPQVYVQDQAREFFGKDMLVGRGVKPGNGAFLTFSEHKGNEQSPQENHDDRREAHGDLLVDTGISP